MVCTSITTLLVTTNSKRSFAEQQCSDTSWWSKGQADNKDSNGFMCLQFINNTEALRVMHISKNYAIGSLGIKFNKIICLKLGYNWGSVY